MRKEKKLSWLLSAFISVYPRFYFLSSSFVCIRVHSRTFLFYSIFAAFFPLFPASDE